MNLFKISTKQSWIVFVARKTLPFEKEKWRLNWTSHVNITRRPLLFGCIAFWMTIKTKLRVRTELNKKKTTHFWTKRSADVCVQAIKWFLREIKWKKKMKPIRPIESCMNASQSSSCSSSVDAFCSDLMGAYTTFDMCIYKCL